MGSVDELEAKAGLLLDGLLLYVHRKRFGRTFAELLTELGTVRTGATGGSYSHVTYVRTLDILVELSFFELFSYCRKATGVRYRKPVRLASIISNIT